MTTRQKKWDLRFLELAKQVASWSKDPSTQVGAVIATQDNRVVSTGYNGFARGVKDREEWLNDRRLKYKLTLHAEENAILFAGRHLEGCRIFTWPFPPCAHCAAKIIQTGIVEVVTPTFKDPKLYERWEEDFGLAIQQYQDAMVRLTFLNPEDP